MKFYNLTPSYLTKKNILARISDIIDRQDFIKGKEIGQLETELREYTGAKHCVTCANGTDALTIALTAAGIGPGDMVVTTPFSFVSTVEAIVRVGAVPLFADIDESTFNLNHHYLLRMLRDLKTPVPKAVIATDLFGLPAAWPEINSIAHTFDMLTVADAAQSFSGSIGSRRVGTLADITYTSFSPTEPLGCYGDGGAIFTDSKSIAIKARALTFHGSSKEKHYYEYVGMDSRLDTIQAAVLLEKLKFVDEERMARTRIFQHYMSFFSGSKCFPQAQLPSGHYSSHSIFSFRAPDREKLIPEFEKNLIPTYVYYPVPLHKLGPYEKYISDPHQLPIAEAISKSIMSIPIMHRPSFTVHQEILQKLKTILEGF